MTHTRVYESVLDTIGNTPIVHLRRICADLPGQIYLKLEMLNPGGSHKARIALSMIYDAERSGELVRGSGQTLIESTGGNTGMGMAMAAAVLGYRLILVIPDNYSSAKQQLLRSFGAEIILSDHRLGNNSHSELAVRLLLRNPDWVMLNQQANPANPQIHEETTAREILDAFGDSLPSRLVAGVGTGGHLTGVARVLKNHNPTCRVTAVVPEGCSLLRDEFVPHSLQGLAVGLVPMILDTSLIDEEMVVSYHETLDMLRLLPRIEGLAVGISSAANIVAARRIAQRAEPGTVILTFAYDGIADYLNVLDPDGPRTETDLAIEAVTW